MTNGTDERDMDAHAWEQLPMVGGDAGGSDQPLPAARPRRRRTAPPREEAPRDDEARATDARPLAQNAERGAVAGGASPARAAASADADAAAASGAEKGPPLEEALARLDAIVRQLEAGNIDLDRSLALFEEGVALSRHASRRLSEAERRIARLVRSLDGSFRTEPFDAGGDEAAGDA
jgi:exodeoxyribonuclease VII small subunit